MSRLKLEHVAQLNVFVLQGQSLQEGFAAFQRIWGNHPNPPMVSVIFVSALAHPDFLAEVDTIAVVPESEKTMALTCAHHKMPDYIRAALTERKLMDAYHERPDYQQSDYIGSLCVLRAKRAETKQKRLKQMLDEPQGSELYMNMKRKKR